MHVLADGGKQDPARRWSLPDRVFFACGACHILAYAFLKAYPRSGFAPLWIKPSKGGHGQPHRGDTRQPQIGTTTPLPHPRFRSGSQAEIVYRSTRRQLLDRMLAALRPKQPDRPPPDAGTARATTP